MSKFQDYLEIAGWKGETLTQRNPSMMSGSRLAKKQGLCPYCKGTGKEIDKDLTEPDNMIFKKDKNGKPLVCSECNGTKLAK